MLKQTERVCLTLLLSASLLGGCKKKKKGPEEVSMPDPGGASADVVSTDVGNGLAMPTGLAPTSMKFDKVYVLDDNTAVITGTNATLAVALRTTDRGRNWTALRADASGWRSWTVGDKGATVLASGERKKIRPRAGTLAPVISARLWFAPPNKSLVAPIDWFPDENELKGAEIKSGFATPALLSSNETSTVVDLKRSQWLIWGRPAGQEPVKPLALRPLLKGTKAVNAPYGRPAQLLTVGRGSVAVRPWPKPGDTLAQATPIAGLPATPATLKELSGGPSCEFGAYSFQRVGPKTAPFVVGVSAKRSFAFKLPTGAKKQIGCGAGAVVAEVFDAKKKEPQLLRCTFDGKCVTPASHPFEIWPEAHQRDIKMVATKQGIVAVMTAKAGTRWGVYLATSTDGGQTFDLPRVVGQGQSDRGFFEVGALIGFPNRTMLLLAANVTGSSRRKWYLLSSDDGGATWGVP